MGTVSTMRLFLLALFALPAISPAAITVTEPDGAGNETVAEGIEFSTYVIGNPWDMEDAEDIDLNESGFVSDAQFVDGIFRANTIAIDEFTDPALVLTFQGVIDTVLALDKGQKFPIDTSKYRFLTMRVRHLSTAGTPTGVVQPLNIYFFEDEASYTNGTFGFTDYINVPSDGDWHVIRFDLLADVSAASTYAWTDFDTVKGLRIDPTVYADIRIEIDWVRLTAPPPGDLQKLNVAWTGGSAPYDIQAIMPGGDVALLAEGVAGHSALVDFSTIPPGAYLVRVTDGAEEDSSSSPVIVNDAPVLNFTQPDIRGDVSQRYSLVELGNPWGPMDADDILQTSGLVNVSYSSPPGTLTATSVSGDSTIVMNTAGPIDTEKYRMLSYSLYVEGEREIGVGSVARILWGDNLSTLLDSDDIIVQEGLNEYLLGDLKDIPIEDGPAGLWKDSPFYFRLDPHEFPTEKNIRIDHVTLTPFDSAAPDFTIEWIDSDRNSDASISLYADTDQVPGNGNETLIAAGLSENSEDSFLWHAETDVPEGVYHLYATINDGLNETTRYATGPIKVGAGAPINISISEPDGIDDTVLAGAEFSRQVEGNFWDLSDLGDIPLSRSGSISGQSIAGGAYTGVSVTGDPFFYLLFPGATSGHAGSNGLVTPIDTARFRYLTFKVRFSAPGPVYLQANFMRSSDISPENVGFTDLLEIFPGQWQVVTIDLEQSSSASSPFSWTDVAEMRGLRIDPGTAAGIEMEFDWFTLTGTGEGTSQYPVTWTVSDPGESTLTLQAIDPDGTRIPLRSGIDPSARAATVDLGRLPVADYRIEAQAAPGPAFLSPGTIQVVTSPDAGKLFNISTRADVGTGNNVTIGGFIIRGSRPKQVLLRGIGPGISDFLPSGAALANPRLTLLVNQDILTSNDNWIDSPQSDIIAASSLAPSDDLEAAVLATLSPGNYTAILDSPTGGTGIGIVEVFDWDNGDSILWNISTRARVDVGDRIAIAGFIVRGPGSRDILIRGIGPSIPPEFVSPDPVLANPLLRLFDHGGTPLLDNDDWKSASNATAIEASGLAPSLDQESAMLVNVPPGNYTVWLLGSDGGSGIGIIEVFDLTE